MKDKNKSKVIQNYDKAGSIFSLVSGFVALQRALAMLRVSVRSLPVSLRVLICISTFELRSEPRTNIFHISGYFWNISFAVHEIANF